ncbi:MAG: RHS repeat-associated core domain-containing protein [Chloroflexota bacterium]
MSRLLEADYNEGSTVYTYGFDTAGNLVNKNGTTRTYNAANQMVNDGTNTLTYDPNGNLTNDGGDAYTWDRANRMLSVGTTSYAYDGASKRIQQTVGSVVTDYLNDTQPGLTKLLVQTTGSDTERFVHARRGIHGSEDNAGNWHYYAQDGLGSVRGVVSDVTAVQASQSYDPYGDPLGSYGDGFGFTGEQTDANGQVYLRARYYNPEMGMFSALDQLEGVLATPSSLNRYAYVQGNPINFTDPSGLQLDNPLHSMEEGAGGGGALIALLLLLATSLGLANDPQVIDALSGVEYTWISRGVDGGRIDGIPYTHELVEEWLQQIAIGATPLTLQAWLLAHQAGTAVLGAPTSVAANPPTVPPINIDPQQMLEDIIGICAGLGVALLSLTRTVPAPRRSREEDCLQGLSPRVAARNYARIARYIYWNHAASLDPQRTALITVAVTRAKTITGQCREIVSVSNAHARRYNNSSGELKSGGLRALASQGAVSLLALQRLAVPVGIAQGFISNVSGVAGVNAAQGHAEPNLIRFVYGWGQSNSLKAMGVSQEPCPGCSLLLRSLPIAVSYHYPSLGILDF